MSPVVRFRITFLILVILAAAFQVGCAYLLPRLGVQAQEPLGTILVLWGGMPAWFVPFYYAFRKWHLLSKTLPEPGPDQPGGPVAQARIPCLMRMLIALAASVPGSAAFLLLVDSGLLTRLRTSDLRLMLATWALSCLIAAPALVVYAVLGRIQYPRTRVEVKPRCP